MEFDQLHPAMQYHVVNSLGWSTLRPTQLAAIAPIHAGTHCLLLAPTAGGKTEAAAIPMLSRMLMEEWPAASVLYICPIKALLNNLADAFRANDVTVLERNRAVEYEEYAPHSDGLHAYISIKIGRAHV